MTKLEKMIDAQLAEMYRFELDKRDKIESGLSLPAGILLAGAGVTWFYLKTLPALTWAFWDGTFVVFGALFALSILAGFYCLTRCIWSYEYAYLPSGGKLLAHYKKVREDADSYQRELQAYMTAHPEYQPDTTDLDERDANLLRVSLRESYADAAEINRNNNTRKSKYRHHLNGTLIAMGLFLLLSVLPLGILTYNGARRQPTYAVKLVPAIHKVRVVGFPKDRPYDVRVVGVPHGPTQEIRVVELPQLRFPETLQRQEPSPSDATTDGNSMPPK